MIVDRRGFLAILSGYALSMLGWRKASWLKGRFNWKDGYYVFTNEGIYFNGNKVTGYCKKEDCFFASKLEKHHHLFLPELSAHNDIMANRSDGILRWAK